MPNNYIQVFYKEYVETMKSREKSESVASEEMEEQIEDAFGG